MDLHTNPDESPEANAKLFLEDDLEFRTITTILHIVGSREKVKLQNFTVASDQRPYLKFLTGFSSLLVRNCEILAILPKRSGHGGTEFFLTSETEEPEDVDDAASSSSSSSSTSSSALYFLTRNPRFIDPPDIPVALVDGPEVDDVGSDILRVVLDNWHQSFDHHVKLFEHLLNICLATPASIDAPVWHNLKTYSLLSSVQKMHRRFRHSPSIKALKTTATPFPQPTTPLRGLTKVDDTNILMVLILNTNARAVHSSLFRMVSAPRITGLEWRLPDDPVFFLEVFHNFMSWLIAEVEGVIGQLNNLRALPEQPESLPRKVISTLLTNLDVLRYFAWKSDFFVAYMNATLGTGVAAGQTSKTPNSEKEQDEEQEREDALDIATEFDTEESPTASHSDVHRCISELRLITCNIQHLVHLQDISPALKRQHICFQILKYPRSDNSLKPWREVLESLFTPHTVALVIQALREASATNPKCRVFHPNGPELVFNGQAHCEAILGCLYTLANGDVGNIAWTGISPELLGTIKNSYNLLAPSKRCCPICAATISLLSPPNDRPPLQALSKHSIIFPCAFPPGLPRNVRVALLERYRKRLQHRLLALVRTKKGRGSAGSGQSEPSSVHALQLDNEESRAERALWGIYEAELEELEAEDRAGRWGEIVSAMEPERVTVWWEGLRASLKLGLKAPEV